jgi:hypothetical protein
MSIDIKSILERNGVDLPIQENETVFIRIDYCILADNKLQFKVNKINKEIDDIVTKERVDGLPILDEALLKSEMAKLDFKPSSTMTLVLTFDSNNVARYYSSSIDTRDPADELLYNIREANHNESCSSGQILSEPFLKPTKNLIRHRFADDSHSSGSITTEEINPSPEGADLNLQRLKPFSPIVPIAAQLVQEPVVEKPESPNAIPVEVQAVSEGNIAPPVLPVPPTVVPIQVAPERRIPQNDVLVSKDDSAISSHKASPTTAAGDLIRTSVQPFVPPPPIQAFTEESQAQAQVPEEVKEEVLDPREDKVDALEDVMEEIPLGTNEKKELPQNERFILQIIDHMVEILGEISKASTRRLVNPGELMVINNDYKEFITRIDDILRMPPTYINEPQNNIQRNNFYRFTSQWPFIKNRLADINDNLVVHTWDYYYPFTNKAMTYLKEIIKLRDLLKLYVFGKPEEDYIGGKAAERYKKKRRTKRGHNKSSRKSKTQRKR